MFYTESTLDYINITSYVMVFGACNNVTCMNITIIDDYLDEPSESFNITLERSANLTEKITLEETASIAHIEDNDGLLNTVKRQRMYRYCYITLIVSLFQC